MDEIVQHYLTPKPDKGGPGGSLHSLENPSSDIYPSQGDGTGRSGDSGALKRLFAKADEAGGKGANFDQLVAIANNGQGGDLASQLEIPAERKLFGPNLPRVQIRDGSTNNGGADNPDAGDAPGGNQICRGDFRTHERQNFVPGVYVPRPGEVFGNDSRTFQPGVRDDYRPVPNEIFGDGGPGKDMPPADAKDTPKDEKPKLADNVTPNDKGLAIKVKYPGDKGTRDFKRDDKTGEVNDIVTKDKDGREISHYVKDGKDWYYQTPEGMRAKLNGNIQVAANGDISFETAPKTWRTERTDGKVQWESANDDGSRVALDDKGRPEKLTRKDNSTVEFKRDGDKVTEVIETNAQGKSRSWKPDGKGDFKSQPPSDETRKNFNLEKNGNMSYEAKGFKYTITGANQQVIEDLGQNTARDSEGRIKSITYPDGKTRTFERDSDGKVNKIITKQGDSERTYVREGNKWYMDVDGMKLALPGKVNVSAKGDFSVETSPGNWRTETTAGQIINQKSTDTGTLVRKDADGKVTQITRPDGSVVAARYDKDGATQIDEYSADGKSRKTWVKQGDQMTTLDGKESRKNFQLMDNGLLKYEQNGKNQIVLPDGKLVTEGPGNARFTFDKNGRFESITYADGDRLQFTYTANGQIKEIQKFQGDKLVKTQTRDGESNKWNVKGPDGKAMPGWTGDYKIDGNGTIRFKEDGAKNPEGMWQVINPDGSHYKEKINSDGSRLLKKPDNSFVEIDKDGLVRKVGTNKDNYRTFEYTNGEVSKVTDYRKGKESSTWEKGKGEERLNAKVLEDGTLVYRTKDKPGVIEQSDLSKIELDKKGMITKVTQANGNTRDFNYRDVAGKTELISYTDTKKSDKGDQVETWTRQASGDGLTNKFVSSKDSKKVRTDCEVGRGGDVSYRTPEGKLVVDRAGKRETGGMSDSVQDARDNFMAAMDGLDENRKQRLEIHLKRFEQRAAERMEAQIAAGQDPTKVQEEWEQKVMKSYDQLTQMVTSDAPGAQYDKNTRIKLAEIMAGQIARPTEFHDQGGHGCCWMISGVNLGVTQNPDKMCKMLNEIVTTQKFTDTKGKTWDIPRSLTAFDREAASWTMDKSLGDGRWNPVSQILTASAAFLSANGRRMDKGSGGGTMEACQHAMRLIAGMEIKGTNASALTGSQWKNELLANGGVILFSPGHMYCGKLEKIGGQWQIVNDNQHSKRADYVLGTVGDLKSWNVSRTGRQQYVGDVTTPNCNDQPCGPGNPGPNQPGPRRWNNQPPPYYPYEPQPYYPQPQYYPQYRTESPVAQAAKDDQSDARDRAARKSQDEEQARNAARLAKEAAEAEGQAGNPPGGRVRRQRR